MTEAQQLAIDEEMATKYQAQRSAVTNKQWVEMKGSLCWVCSYYSPSSDVTKRPTLYMVHFVSSPVVHNLCNHYVYRVVED